MQFTYQDSGPIARQTVVVDESKCTFGPTNQPTGLTSIYSATFRVQNETVHGVPFSSQTHQMKITISKTIEGSLPKYRYLTFGSASEADKIHYRVVISTPNKNYYDMGILRHQTDLKGDALHCRCSGTMFTVHVYAELAEFGRKWKKLPAQPVAGRLVQCDALGEALKRKTSFTKKKWDSLGCTVLGDDDYYILQQAGKPDEYYGPVPHADLGNLKETVKQMLKFVVVCELKTPKGPNQAYRSGTIVE